MKKHLFFLLQLFLPVFCSISWIQGTKSQTSFRLGVNQPAEIKVDWGTDVSIDVGNNTILGGSPTASGGTGNPAYLWLPSEYLNDETQSNPTAQPPGNVTF